MIPKGYDLGALEIFSLVCELRSMTLAAERLGVTQPAVSQTIKQLEAALGVSLLDRGRRPLMPTAAGEWLAATSAHIMRDVSQIASTVRRLKEGAALRLRLGLVDSLSDPFVPEMVRRLRSSIHFLSIASGLARTLRSGLMEHNLDLIITNDPVADTDEIARRVILTEPYLLVLPASASLDAADLDHLARAMPLIRWSARSYIGADIDRQLRRMRIDIPRQFEFDSAHTILGMVAAGLGWAVMTPISIFEMKPLLSRVRVLPFSGPSFARDIAVVTRQGEIDSVSAEIARVSRRILTELYVPEILKTLPWLANGALTVGSET